MTSEKYIWVGFYKELARKLLSFKNNREELVKLVPKIFEKSNIEMPNLPIKSKLVDIDPFTIFGFFNKGIRLENRIKIATSISSIFGIKSEIPEEFMSIPIVNNLSATYFSDEESINKLWRLFESAINYSDNKSNENKDDFINNFDEVIILKGLAKAKLTIGLYWIDSDTFLNLDSTNVDYIYESERFSSELINTFPKNSKRISGLDYFYLLESIEKELEKEGNKQDIFRDFSLSAWEYSENKNNDKENKVDLLEDKIKSKPYENSYWWFVPNSSDWTLSSLAIDTEQIYSILNEKGNYRKRYSNLLSTKKGDKIIGYDARPTMAITALLEITKDADSENIYFKKVASIENAIKYNEIKNDELLSKSEFTINHTGSLHSITEVEYNYIIDLLENKNPGISSFKNITINESEERYATYTKEDFLNEVYISEEKYEDIKNVLLHKKNIILQGAPGVGKTFAAKRIAYSIMGQKDEDKIGFVQFHQNYSYEDFIMGYRPNEDGFELKKGIFYDFCKKAENNPNEKYFFIIDEINRGNLSKIFGELMMLIEKDYRDHKITMGYSGRDFSIPSNIYLIGMMNTADRSLAMIDYALRRRFSFIDIEPGFESEGFQNYKFKLENEKFNKLVDQVITLNSEISNDDNLGNGFCIGHSYLCNFNELEDIDLSNVVDYEIIPLLREYWFDEPNKVDAWHHNLKGVIK